MTEEEFENLRRWCASRDQVGNTPRLIIDFESPSRQISYREEEDGPVVRMGPETYRSLRDWVDRKSRFAF